MLKAGINSCGRNYTRGLMPHEMKKPLVYWIGLDGSLVDFKAMKGFRATDPTDYDTGKISQDII